MDIIQLLDLRDIVPGDNDRTRFDPAKLQELADSIKANGLAQPITVRPIPDTELYRIVAGERRYRACQLAGLVEIPAIVRDDLSDEQASAIMLAENVGRQDLDPLDEANAYAKRIRDFGYTPEQIAEQCGVSTVRVQFSLKLLKLRPEIQDLVRSGNLSRGYAQVLADAGLDSNFQMRAVALLRENPRPNPQWLRRTCAELLTQQAQSELFDAPLFSGPLESPVSITPLVTPPSPGEVKPPQQGSAPHEILRGQIQFWQDAAAQWDTLGKPFKRQECHAAAQALMNLETVLVP